MGTRRSTFLANERPRYGMRWVSLWGLLIAVVACGESAPKDPFLVHDAGAGGTSAEGGAAGDSGEPTDTGDPQLGAPCLDDAQCDDDIDCTLDACDLEFERCRHVPDSEPCQDDTYCDGEEVCEIGVGCVEGDPVACSDDDSCTIDRCVEQSRSCEHFVRDSDGDGDGVWNCGDGGDCDDQNPRVNSLREEICGNGIDDNCNQEIDEDSCRSPEYDRCDDPLRVDESGSYLVSFAAAGADYGISCLDSDGLLDVVVDLVVPEGPPRDVDITALGDSVKPALALRRSCDDASSELACSTAIQVASGQDVARLRAFALEPGHYSLVTFAEGESDILLSVSFEAESQPPDNETCATAARLEPGQVTRVLPYVAQADHETSCERATGDLLYSFALEETSDVHLYANGLDAYAAPVVSLRNSDCNSLQDELTCRGGGPQAHLFARSLGAGTYFVMVSATAPGALTLLVEVGAQSEPPDSEDCAGAPDLPEQGSVTLEMNQHTDTIAAGCLVGAVDAAYRLRLDDDSDVLLLENFAVGAAGIGLASASCSASTTLSCDVSEVSPLRVVANAVPAGDYRVVAESAQATDLLVNVFQRPATSPVLVPFSDSCEKALLIPESGGRFYGNTATLTPSYDASCDYSRTVPPGSPDQMLRLNLSEPRRVVFDMRGSEYDTLLVVRSAESCPGDEVSFGCSPSLGLGPSYLDLDLPAGEYFVQIDGYAGAAGPWQLDVFTRPL